MKKAVFTLLLSLAITNISIAQTYFIPKVGGLENAKDGGDFFKVELKDKSANDIYQAILTMVKKEFTGEDDEILETVDGELIKAKGVIKKFVCSKDFDVRFNVEFKIKDGRYIFLFNKYNIVQSNGAHRIVFQKGSNILGDLGKSDGKTYMFNRKGKVSMQKSCYKDIVKSLDVVGKLFDLTSTYDKYANQQKKNESGW